MLKKITALLLGACFIFSAFSCNNADDTESKISSSDVVKNSSEDNTLSSSENKNEKPQMGEKKMNIFEGRWEPMPMVNEELRALGVDGGEGGQWELSVVCDAVDGQVVFSGTDVGGAFRSLDGGDTWTSCNVGLSSRGVADFAIDPYNTTHVIAMGANSVEHSSNGLYVSYNTGSTWEQTYSALFIGHRDFRNSLAFDRSSYDEDKDMTMTAYWSRLAQTDIKTPIENINSLYKTTDGGETWVEIAKGYGDGCVEVHPEKGYVYVAKNNGTYKSTDGGVNFTKVLDEVCTGVDTVASKPNNVYVSTHNGLFVSEDSGETFNRVDESGYMTGSENNTSFIAVSPANPDVMMVCKNSNDYNRKGLYSHDGGKTWKIATWNSKKSFIPYNNRQTVYAFSPVDENIVFSLGGDYTTKSVDGGKNFEWNHNGNVGIMTGAYFNFNVNNPDLMYFGSQDYNGAVTRDGGENWYYVDMHGQGWGGMCYGGYAIDENTYVTGASAGWAGEREVRITFDGGKTFNKTGLTFEGYEIGYGDPNNENVAFIGPYRTEDKGKTWQLMQDCDGVFTHNPSGDKELYGVKNNTIVVSRDGGKTWKMRYAMSTDIEDIAYDHVNNFMYVVDGNALIRVDLNTADEYKLTENIPVNKYGERRLQNIAVDPNTPYLVYVSGGGHRYNNENCVMASEDSGETWHVLTKNTTNSIANGEMGAGWETGDIAVNPKTGDLWTSGGCFGLARYTSQK